MKTRELTFTLVDNRTGSAANEVEVTVNDSGHIETICLNGKNYAHIGDIELFMMALIGVKNFQAMVSYAFSEPEPKECEITAFKNSSLSAADEGSI